MKNESNGDENHYGFKRKEILLAAALVALSAATLAPTNVVNADEITTKNQYERIKTIFAMKRLTVS